MAESTEIDYGDALKRSWNIFTESPMEFVLGFLLAQLSMILLVTVGPAFLGIAGTALEAARGKPITIGSSFAGYSHFGSALVLSVLTGLAVIIGFMLLVVPGIIAALFLSWANFYLWDNKDSGAVDAMKASVDLAKANFLATLITLILVFALSVIGQVTVVGFLITTPLSIILMAIAYDQLRAGSAKPVG